MSTSLAHIDWPSAVERAAKLRLDPGTFCSMLSLSALYTPNFEDALSSIQEAHRTDPFNPLHELRHALLLARFGNVTGGAAALERLRQSELQAPVIDYLRALFTLRVGRPEQARAIAGGLESAHPRFDPAKFLRAEAHIVMSSRAGTVERYLRPLPSGTKWDSLWADLLVKLVLLHPDEGPALAAGHLEKKVTPGSPAHIAVQRAIAWVGTPVEEFGQHLESEPAGSRAEALLLECLVDKLGRMPSQHAIRMVSVLRKQHPQRPALRRMYHAFLTRRAAEFAGAEQYEEALRLIERSLYEEPHDFVYYQNRAALFTLMREAGPYHDAWAALNAHQYRLMLLGACDSVVIGQIVKMHRLFEQQARGAAGSSDRFGRGIFRATKNEDGGKPRLLVNSDEIASDPDLLRQWIYHASAELVFRHAALGSDGRRALLEPGDPDEAMARAEALGKLSGSLSVLVSEEGAELARQLDARWRAAASTVRTRYDSPALAGVPDNAAGGAAEEDAGPRSAVAPGDEQVRQLEEEHANVLADLCLICLQWRPEHNHRWIAEELLEFAQAELAFLDGRVLRRLEDSAGYEMPYTLQVLSNHVRHITGEERLDRLSGAQRNAAVAAMIAELLREMAVSTYEGNTGTAKDSAAQAMAYIDRARACRAADAEIELTAARLLSLGEYFEEARKALERFRRLVKPDNPRAIEQADKIDDLLRERQQKGEAGHRRERHLEIESGSSGDDVRIEELLRELDGSPSSWQLYDELVKEMVVGGRFDEAIQWSDRAVAQCLGRTEQINVRGLAIEARGMKALAEASPRAAKLYAVGAHEPARKALKALAEQRKLDYALLYLLGRCQLAGGLPEEARASFQASFDVCDRQLYRTVLRRLTEDIDHAYLAVARSAVDRFLQDGDLDEAINYSSGVFARLTDPAAWLVDYGRVFYSAALRRVGTTGSPTAATRVVLEAPWRRRFDDALAAGTDVERALRLTALAVEVHPGSARQAQLLAERTRTLQHQIGAVDALNSAGRLLSERKFDDVLTFLDRLDPELATESRLRRLRVLALLGLQRFDEADRTVAEFGQTGSAEVQDFLANYPSFVFRQRVAMAQRMLREGHAREARAVLDNARPNGTKEEGDLAYCAAFAAALEGYELRRSGNAGEARARFVAAIALLEPYLPQSGTLPHILELFDRVEKEAEAHVE